MAPSLVELDLPSAEYSTGHIVRPITKSTYSSEGVCELDLSQSWPDAHKALVPQATEGSTFLKAAWILTLRCFQPEEVIHMCYDEELVQRSGTPIVFTVRVNPDWNLQSLLEALEVEQLPTGSCSSLAYGTRLSELPFRHVRTSTLKYLTVPEQNFIPSSPVNGNLEVSQYL